MTIPVSTIISVQPGVLGSGGTPLSLNGVILSQSLLLPTGRVVSFNSSTAVKNFFGAASAEYTASLTYFLGNDNSTIKPTLLYFAPYNLANRAAWLQSGSLSGMSLTQLQALSGTLIVTVDGVVKTSSSINLSSATSFSNAATLIQAGFTGSALTVAYSSLNNTFIITSTTSGVLSTIGYATGTLSTGIKLTSATGAVLSQGAVADTPATAMDSAISITQNWVDFTTMWEPDLANKTLFAIWTNAQNQRYLYVPWDTDGQAIVNGSTTNFAYIVNAAEYDGISTVYNTLDLAVFMLGLVACVDFSRTNGRITAAFKHQSGFTATVTDSQIAANLLGNGYNFYGSYATANDQFNFLYNGQMSGKWKWVDTYINQVFLNSQFQLALIALQTQVNSIPYTPAGYSLLRLTLADPIAQMLNFGGIRKGVTLSSAQKAQANQAAGLDIASIIETEGYYLQILDPGAQVRGNRGTPVMTFWYTDGGAIHSINLASIDIM